MSGHSTEWQVGYGGYYRRERGVLLRVRQSPSGIPCDDDPSWRAEIDTRGSDPDDFLTMVSGNSLTAQEAKNWCDTWSARIIPFLQK